MAGTGDGSPDLEWHPRRAVCGLAFLSTWLKVESSRRRTVNQGDTAIRFLKASLFGIFLVNDGLERIQSLHCGQCCPWAGGSGLYKTAA